MEETSDSPWIATLAGIERLVPGFTAVVGAFDSLYFDELEEHESFIEWFEGNDRRALIHDDRHGSGRIEVVVYEGTGQYVDSWKMFPRIGWIHVEGETIFDLERNSVRELLEDELDEFLG